RALVVFLHRRDGLGLESTVTDRDTRALRRGRSRLLPQPHQIVQHLVAYARARASARDHVAFSAMGRRVHPAAGGIDPQSPLLAARVRTFRRDWRRLGALLLSLVSRQSARAP